ncbi:hypothetical protein IFR05_001737 [Cadophora sp. M221]|nr:hypothetical protein IFR05_001737 [Cadophora sp. M221]
MRYSIPFCMVLAAAFIDASILGKRAECQEQANACRTAPNANQSFCSAQLSACLGYNPYANDTATTTSSSYVPKESCQAVADKCRTKPNANQATCSAELAACLGYNPYDHKSVWTTETVTKFTTYCPEPTTLVYNHKTYTATKDEVLTITNCPCTITKPVNPPSKPTSTSSPDDCQKKNNECRSKPDANQATCSAELAQCLGYNPYTNPAQPQATQSAAPEPKQDTPAGNTPAAPAPKQDTPAGNPQAQPGTPVAGTPDSPAATYTGPVVNNPAATPVTTEFTGAASLAKPAAGLLGIAVVALAFL